MARPNNPRTIRFMKHPKGDHWQYWGKGLWRKLTEQELDTDTAKTVAAVTVYDCRADDVYTY